MLINFKQKNNNKGPARLNSSGGFTLIEIMVSTSIFMIIMLIAMGALITSSDATKKISALRTAMDSVNFAMESMTRTLRTGTDYSCVTTASPTKPPSLNVDSGIGSPNDCLPNGGGGQGIIFSSAHTYNAVSSDTGYTIMPRSDTGSTNTLMRCDASSTPRCSEMVSSNVDIQKLMFYVKGSAPLLSGDTTQPSVYIIMQGAITIKDESTFFSIQTMVDQRSVE